MMLGLITAITDLAGTWVKSKAESTKATAEAKATALKTAAQSTADWERIMAEASKNSWKDEWLTLVFSIPLILSFIPSAVPHIQSGFDALSTLPVWYHEILMVIVLASFGVKAGKGIMEMVKK
tara:strand:- start:1254 stop:1622 length:369 start_codon:yes stop_codon:yes gene_type:complete